MHLKVKNQGISINVHGADNFRESINFQVTAEGRNRILIADKYEFGGRFPEKDKEQISGRFNISKFDPHYAKHHKLDNEKIGVLDFFESHVDEFGAYSIPAKIYFTVYLQEAEYERIRQAVLSQLPISYLVCGLDGFDYGWEPDGSTKIWKLKEGEESKSDFALEKVYITNFGIGFGKPFDDEYWEGRDDDEVESEKPEPKQSAIKAWLDENGWYAAVMGLIIGYLLFK